MFYSKDINKILLKISLGGIITGLFISLTNLYLIITESGNIDRTFIWGLDRTFLSDVMISLIPYSLFLLPYWIESKHKGQESKYYKLKYIILSVILILQFINLLVLRTRSAWVSVTVILFVLIWIVWRHYYYKKIIMQFVILISAIILIAIIISLFVNLSKENDRQSLYKAIISIGQIKDASNQTRFSYWRASINMFKDNPFTGVKSGKWPGIYPLYNGESYTDENVDIISAINPHNDYLEILTEFGIFGFLIYTCFIFTGLYFLFKKSMKKIIYLPFFLSALGLSITMFFSFPKDNIWAMIVFSVCMGVGYSSNSEFRIQNSEFYSKYNRYIKTFVFAVGILMLCTGIWFKVTSYFNQREYLEAMNLKAQGKYFEMLNKLDGVSSFYYSVDMNKMPVDYYRGVGYFELKQYDKALKKFRNAREFMKYYPTVMNNEASALYMNGSISESENLFIEIKNLFPNYIEPQINLLSLYTNMNKITEAKNIITEIEKKPFDGKYVKNYSVFLEIKNYLIEKQK